MTTPPQEPIGMRSYTTLYQWPTQAAGNSRVRATTKQEDKGGTQTTTTPQEPIGMRSLHHSLAVAHASRR